MPLQPGVHNLKARLSKPIPSTYIGYLASIFGYQPELVQPSLLASGEGNHCKFTVNIKCILHVIINYILVIRMLSNGYAKLSFNVLTKGLRDFGYNVGYK